MVERVESKGIIVSCSLFIIIATSMLLEEFPVLYHHPHFILYLTGRMSIIAGFFICLGLSFLQIEFVYQYFSVIFYILSLAYNTHGQYFQPNYWLAYIECTTVFPFIFQMEKHLLAALMITGLILFDITFIATAPHFTQLSLLNKSLSTGILIGTALSTFIAYTTAEIFIKEKMKKNQIYQRFIDLGKNVSSIVHDIKGMISGPCTYSDMLYEKAQSNSLGPDDKQVIEFLKEDISAVRAFVMEMNQLVSTPVTDQESLIQVSEVVKSVTRVFRSKIKKIKIEIIGDLWLVTKVDYINRILINSIVNACEAIHKNNKIDGKITIHCEKNILDISDNSGEKLSDNILKKLNSTYANFTDKAEGSGLGVILIRDYINTIGGKFKYHNNSAGVSLKIHFPNKIIVPNERTKGNQVFRGTL